jgi:hypothetical protein
MSLDTELLTSVDTDELAALAAGVLVPATQARLDELLAAGKLGRLSAHDEAELNDLLNKVDHLNLLKARARYTLDQLGAKAAST